MLDIVKRPKNKNHEPFFEYEGGWILTKINFISWKISNSFTCVESWHRGLFRKIENLRFHVFFVNYINKLQLIINPYLPGYYREYYVQIVEQKDKLQKFIGRERKINVTLSKATNLLQFYWFKKKRTFIKIYYFSNY